MFQVWWNKVNRCVKQHIASCSLWEEVNKICWVSYTKIKNAYLYFIAADFAYLLVIKLKKTCLYYMDVNSKQYLYKNKTVAYLVLL